MLPIDDIRPDFLSAASSPGARILLSAPTGSGKSTRIPGMMLEAGWGERGTVLVVQPRRLAARLLAGYVARQYPCPLGQEVGYAVRFDSRQSSKTRILFVTDGILERRLTDDPELRGISAVIFDEIHERRLSGDLCLARVLDLTRTVRPDLGLVVMSATLDIDQLHAYLGPETAILRAHGKMYPVETEYMPPRPVRDSRGIMAPPPVWQQCADALRTLIRHENCGDILIFLPGAYEIRRTAELLEHASWLKDRDIYPLHGQLSPEAQNKAVECGTRPRVIISTNIAETSLTIEGVRSVIDSGTAREACWDPRRGISTLHIVPISQAQAEQRKGRAGRLAPGYCIRLWSEADHARRAPFPSPEVHRADISAAYLNLLAWGQKGREGMETFHWLDAPSTEESERAWQLLEDLGAVTPEGTLSSIGRRMLAYPLAPVLARLMIAGEDENCQPEMAAIAALIQGENILLGGEPHDSLKEPDDYTDFQAEWRAVEKARALSFDPSACNKWGIMARAAREIDRAWEQLLRGREGTPPPAPDFHRARQGITRALVESFADRVAARNGIAANTARLTRKRSGKIASGSVALKGQLFVAAEVAEIGGRGVETKIGRCTLITIDDLKTATGSLIEETAAAYDKQRKRVFRHLLTRYRDLILEDREKGDADPEQAAPLLAEQVVAGTLPLDHWDGHVEQWIRRLNGLRQWMPELELPSFDTEDRLVAIAMICEGAIGYKDIKERQVMPVLREWLSPWQREALDRYAPTSLQLSNGQNVKLRYREDSTPVFGLKAQLLFGVRETPVIAQGKIKVLAEILAPNQRPWQITDNLAGFWKTGYPQMKKDLAGRYPRQKWPDDV
ncbi:ATP-dependent helicase HrpB [Akkermansia glycaniphila]|uniref:ATP-dependent helicase HrpB n=1 Tax=Akkermansia glycaniphila TaxID=1679444 RepID=UPI001C038085|nr:ATP-dependent helicase HrpB [Akkermansia glycaniphila]MBT9448988.1 ATP-dependent helicase HrpB [Akkermansia glycaniphila]